ncbi:MAG: phenylacetate-CoA oxygenase subunit PaaJ [Chloroflexi bacterium]|nr:phenylacetate-CoA oxygenase subunit PaaJ [Chloroflexota bacterium]
METRPEAEARVWAELAEIPDPEIPAISVVDLGVIGGVAFEDGRLRVQLLPTFVGCPAIDVMRQEITERLDALELADSVIVDVTFDPPWTSDRISERGRERLRRSGFAPPAPLPPGPVGLIGIEDLATLPVAECPYCGSSDTRLDNPFGPTLCRAIYHCSACRQPFEQFKRV